MTYVPRQATPIKPSIFSVDDHAFPTGGAGDFLQLDFIDDPDQGLNTTAKTFAIRNDGGGTIYFMTSLDESDWSETMSLRPGDGESYVYDDGIEIALMKVWASAAGTRVTIRATPGR